MFSHGCLLKMIGRLVNIVKWVVFMLESMVLSLVGNNITELPLSWEIVFEKKGILRTNVSDPSVKSAHISFVKSWGITNIIAFFGVGFGFLGKHSPSDLLADKIDNFCAVLEEKKAKNKCAICLEEYEHTDRVKKLACAHCFHRHCIVGWHQISNTCPICRHSGI